MPKNLLKRWHGQYILWTYGLLLGISLIMFIYQWVLGAAFLLVTAVLFYFSIKAESVFREDLDEYVSTLSYRVKKAGSEVLTELPVGILLYDEDHKVEWNNPYVTRMLGKESVIHEELGELFPGLSLKADEMIRYEINERIYEVRSNEDERLIYFRDITDQVHLQIRYEEEKLAIGLVMLDNLDEISQAVDDQTRSILLAKVTSLITDWSHKHRIYLRRTSSDRFLILMDQVSLKELEQGRFEILDDVRELTTDQKIPLTLSIGIASGLSSLEELGQMAQASLDMSLGRGGDQVTVKVGQRLSFYGGRSNAVEKRTRVRARVISHAFKELIKQSDKVVIMGHRFPDMDAIGAAIGVLKAAQLSDKEGYIVIEGINPSISKLMEMIDGKEELCKWFISPQEAQTLITQRTLTVIVDTHKASMIAEPKLLQQTSRIVVVDHHRRGEEFIKDAALVYMEPYASSTCELVTELLQYFADSIPMDTMEATVLLAGIVVDTKSFSLRTGARTFEAASFLRRHGADPSLVQKMMKEDLHAYIEKAEIIKHTEIIYDHVALAVAEPNHKYSQLMIAQVADTLLNMTGIKASFVIGERSDGLIGISARSLGDLNVQVVMERLGGGGHLTNAATQLGSTTEDAARQLKSVLMQIEEEEGLFE
ncbi:DHH family phosphoesterase [Paenibacillus larvae]|uniref:DHH family phosphoesterase n=1 Tax=Paenibacillus larvae TaxID=1464 RepID=UPI00227F3DAC|nr:DHH family phosphoesterase [Paenibacillus larvae]MCY7475255.1 DHH family phosphoesterase [Paenibacillus larvae]MDE5168058.1 DHH family phosphoesterase [Paenibacillus larvae subsp. larvae]